MVHLGPTFLVIEVILTLIALVYGLLIYFKTKESYDLTKHEGIRYFRDAFLFFGLSYVLRFLFSVIFLSRIIFDVFIPREFTMPFFIVLLGYFSTISLWYLILSFSWKKLTNHRAYILLGHAVALVVSILAFITHSPLVMLYIQLAFIISAIVFIFSFKADKKRFTPTKMLYFLVALLWICNLLTADGPFMPRELEIILQAIAIGLFVIIYHKISKWIK